MGEQSLYIKSRQTLLQDTQDFLEKAADDQFLKEHFLLGRGVDMDKVMFHLLMEYALCTTNCEIIDWIWYKINGALPNGDDYEFQVQTTKPNISIYNITNYVKEESSWSEIQW